VKHVIASESEAIQKGNTGLHGENQINKSTNIKKNAIFANC